MSELAREVNRMFDEGDRINVQFFGRESFGTGVFIAADDNFLLWVDDSENALRVAPLNLVRIGKIS